MKKLQIKTEKLVMLKVRSNVRAGGEPGPVLQGSTSPVNTGTASGL